MEYTTYELQCPCGYHYWVAVFREPEWERCPICGLGMEFRLFLKEGAVALQEPRTLEVVNQRGG